MTSNNDWRARAAVPFECVKRSASGGDGVIAANHPLGAAAGAEMLAAGGNAVDAAVATLLTLTVVEPMMVGLVGGGMMHIRSNGEHIVIDGQSQAPASAAPDMFEPVSDEIATRLETRGRQNAVGPRATATAGSLLAWCRALERFGTFSFADVIEPAIRHAERGFAASPYLSECTAEVAADLALDPEISKVFLPNGAPIRAGARLVQPAYAQTLRALQQEGPGALHGGPIGAEVDAYMRRHGGALSLSDLQRYAPIEREPVRGTYAGVEIIGPPPPSSGGIHVIQMLNILEGFDIGKFGYGSTEAIHLLAEVMKIAFADRDASTGDPDFLDVPVQQLLDKAYADRRRDAIAMDSAKSWSPGVPVARESAHTTHMTVVDGEGLAVTATHTINSLFGARYIIGDTGMIANNYMFLFDPHPGRALSIAPGKRVPTSMAPLMGLRDGELEFALGVVGGVRIFPSAMQAVVNLLTHGMSLQEAVEAPRVWTQGGVVELETSLGSAAAALQAKGHETVGSPHLGGGMNGVRRLPDGRWEGAACWRADGVSIGLGGGRAKSGIRFRPEAG